MSGSSGSQCSPAHEVHNGISPVLINQFSVYEPLKPQKVVLSPTSSENEDLLIDFESPIEANRTSEQEDFNVIDLFQNIYVTPQLVNNKPNTETEPRTDVDYQDFLRKLESRNKKCSQNLEKVQASPKNSLLDLDFTYIDEISETKHQFSENNNDSNTNSLCIETMSSFNHEIDEYQEELIEEILLERTLEKLKVSDVRNDQTLKNLRVLSTPNIFNVNMDQLPNAIHLVPEQIEDPKMGLHWKRDYEPTLNLYYGYDKKDRSNENVAIQTSSHNNNSATTSKISDNISNNTFFPKPQSSFVSEKSLNPNQEHNVVKSYSNADRYHNKDNILVPAINYTHLNDISNRREGSLNIERILHLETPQQNYHQPHHDIYDYIKLYAKNDSHRNNNRIKPTKNEDDKNYHSLLYNQNVPNHANVNITQKNTNLKELKSTVNDSQTKSFISDITTLLHLTVDPAEMMTMPVQAVIKDSKEFAKSHKTKSNTEKVTYSKGPDLNEKSIVLPQLLSRLSAQKDIRDAKNNVKKRLLLHSGGIYVEKTQDQASVELDPTILMKDCNRERLIAYNTGQRLSNLVQSGNIL